MVNVRAHVFVQGRVQAVSYRWWTQRRAQSLELTGWVRNLDDGRVEAVFEGTKKNLEKIIEKCKTGPRFSKVTHIDVVWEKSTGEFESFEITS